MRYGRGLAALFVVLAGCLLAPANDLPEPLRKDLDKKVNDCNEACKSAEKKLLDALDAEKDLIRKQPGLKAEAKTAAIAAIDVEKETFEKHGTVPFSPRMRPATLAYLKGVRQATRPAEAAYDKAVDYHIKKKDDAAAAALTAENKAVVPRRLVGAFTFSNANRTNSFDCNLFADGKGGSDLVTWELSADKLLITNRQPGSPPGGWKDVVVFDGSGRACTAKNQVNAVHNGMVVEPQVK